MKLKRAGRFTGCDLAAALCGLCILFYFLFTIRLSISMPDEPSYYILWHRLSFGDRMISDEWNLTQFGSLPMVPLYLLYHALFHSTEGIVLFMRHVFLGADLLLYAYMYKKLRRFGAAGVIASALFCAMFPQTFLGFSYCTVTLMSLMTVCLALFFDKKKKSSPLLFFSGLLFALSVLENPFLIFMFALWLVFVIVYAVGRRKGKTLFPEFSFLLDMRAFLLISLACAALFAVFICILLMNGAFEELGSVLPYLFTGDEYNAGNLISGARIMSAVRYFGVVFIAGLAACLAAAAVVRILKPDGRYASPAVMAAAGVFLAGSLICAGIKTLRDSTTESWILFCQFHHFSLMLFAPIPFLLDPRPDRKRTAVLVIGILYSVLMDIPGSSFLAFGGFFVRVPLILQLSEYVRYRRREHTSAREPSFLPDKAGVAVKAVFRGVCALSLAVCLCWELGYIAVEGVYKVPEKAVMHTSQPMDHTLTKGVYKGIKTTASMEWFYESTLSDLDIIRADPDCAVAVLEFAPFAYFYLDRPYAAYSPVFYGGEIGRLSAYWKLPHTRKPDYIYLPYYNYTLFMRYDETILNDMLQRVLLYVDGDVTRGKAGFIISVNGVL